MIIESATITALVLAIVEVVKRTGTIDTTKYAPALAVVLAVGFSFLNGITSENLIIGLTAGFVANGIWDNLKSGAKVAGL